MSDPVFVIDANSRPLMPISAPYARRLIARDKAHWFNHATFRILHLHHHVATPHLYPCVLGLIIGHERVRCLLIAEGKTTSFPLAEFVIDLHTDLGYRLRRRVHHRRRRHTRHPHASRQVSKRYRSLGWQGTRLHQWRVHAIVRVIGKLKMFIPISHTIILEPPRQYSDYNSLTNAERRELLAKRDGLRCAYCGTTAIQLELDHVIPRSRGGTDTLANLVLACPACNHRKAECTPSEANLTLNAPHKPTYSAWRREQVLIQQTSRLLIRVVVEAISFHWASDATLIEILKPSTRALFGSWDRRSVPCWIAKPIARLRQQRFYARNYPLSTPTNQQFVRIGTAVKRRVAVNQSIAVWRTPRFHLKVIKTSEPEAPDARYHIRRGMVGEITHQQRRIRGVVGAIHSSGRVTLLVPEVHPSKIVWKCVAVSVRQLRIVSRDGVAFLKVLPNEVAKE